MLRLFGIAGAAVLPGFSIINLDWWLDKKRERKRDKDSERDSGKEKKINRRK